MQKAPRQFDGVKINLCAGNSQGHTIFTVQRPAMGEVERKTLGVVR